MESKGQRLTALSSMTLRGLIQKANEEGLARENIVSVLKENESFIMLYCK